MVSSVDPTATPATSQAAPAPAATATASSPAPPPGITTSAPDPQQQQPQQQNYPPNPYPNYPPPSPTSGGFAPPPQGYPGYQYPPQGAPPQGFYPPQSPHYPQPPSPSQAGFPQYPPPGQQPYPYPPQQYPQQPGPLPQQFPPQQPGQQFPQQYPPQPYPQYPPSGGFQQYPPPSGFPGYGAPSSSIPTINTDTKPSPGYGVNEHDPSYDPSTDANIIKKAFTDRKVDVKAVLGILTKRTPVQIEMLKPHLFRHSPAELTNKSPQTDEAVKAGVHALLYGPRDFYAFLIYTATNTKSKSGFSSGFKGAWMLSLALLGRKKEDVAAIKEAYKRMYGDTLLGHLNDALAKKDYQPLQKLYANALECIANPGVSEVEPQYQQQVKDAVDKEADELFTATVGTVEGEKFAWIFATSSKERLKDIQTAFAVRHKQKLHEVVEKKLKKLYPELKDELLYILDGLENPAKRDAKLLEETMKGFGTKDTKLTYRLISTAWDRDYLKQVKLAYKSRYPEADGGLVGRIKGDTSGSQQAFLVQLAESDGSK